MIIDEAHDPQFQHPFKGNVDLAKVQALIDEVGADRIPYVSLAGTVNMAGGQPVSMANVRELRALCDAQRHQADARRDAHGRERAVHPGARGGLRGQDHRRRSCSSSAPTPTAPGCRAKKDNLVNIGGWLAVNDQAVFEELRNLVVVYEGLHTYGGLAGRDMEALAIGIEESVSDEHIRSRVGQVRYLGELLQEWDIPIVRAHRRPRDLPGRAALLPAPRRRTSSRPRRWPRSCTSTPASGRWSAASRPPAATRRPATTTGRSWS